MKATKKIHPKNVYELLCSSATTTTFNFCSQIENYGELVGWKAADNFDVVLKTDYDNLTKLVYYFSKHNVDINHDMQLLKLESESETL